MAKYDAIIIGTGIGGLSVGALLAKAGKKVLVLEKDNHIGGRAYSTTHRGHIVDNGVHGALTLGHLEEVFSRVGKPFPEGTYMSGTEVWHEGKWRKLSELFSRQELRKIINEDILPLSYEDIGKYDDIQLTDWIAQKTDDEGLQFMLCQMAWITIVGGNKREPMSASEMLFLLKEQLSRGGGFKGMGILLHNGIMSLMTPLVEVIKENGSEVRLNANASNIVVKDGKVRGVEIEKGERIIPIQVLDTEFIEAPVVVSNLPIWSLFSVISPEEFPGWYIEWIKAISEKVTYIWGIRYSLDRPLFDESVLRWWEKSPTGGKIGPAGAQPQPGYGKTVDEYVVDFWQQASWDDMPPHFKSGHTIFGHEARKVLKTFEKDIEALFPGIEKYTRDKLYYATPYGLAEAPTTVGVYRPGMQPPGIKNLYLVSDTMRETRASGTASVARCALLCVDKILKGTG